MKSKFLGILFVVLLPLAALAGFRGYNSTTDLKIFDTIQCSTGLTCSRESGKMKIVASGSFGTTSISGTGSGTVVGFKQSQVASTTTTLTIAQCGSTVISNSADVIGLPEASTALGCRYTFVCGTADDFDVNPDNADIIGPISVAAATAVTTITPSAGDAIRCTDIGSSVTLEAIAVDRWAAIGPAVGPWTDVN